MTPAMKQLYIADLKPNDDIQGVSFALKNQNTKTTAAGKTYKDLILQDKTGDIPAKIWSDALADCEPANPGDIVSVDGTVSEFKNQKQLTIKHLMVIDRQSVNSSDYIKSSIHDPEKLYLQIKNAINEVADPFIQKLLKEIFKDKNFIEKFKLCPAAEYIHHAYLHGLMEHITDMLLLSRPLKDIYPKLNMDILTAGIILHDAGKVYELNTETATTRTTAGHLLGHITIISNKISALIAAIKDFPAETALQVQHVILSHHGELEFGSPIKPMTTEALALHHLDQLSSKTNLAYMLTEELQTRGENISDRLFALGNRLYAPNLTPSNDGADTEGTKQTLF
ncbi:TPA: 3'-5' exonuclease [Candidatus Falkowbacteria bacterium]|nr:3'-5' exonuclease [Candidatus Falkowbacteria bacterium]